MGTKSQYEERIIREIRTLPDEAFPKVARLILLIKEEFYSQDVKSVLLDERTNHHNTRGLLATSRRNWAHDVIADREDRL